MKRIGKKEKVEESKVTEGEIEVKNETISQEVAQPLTSEQEDNLVVAEGAETAVAAKGDEVPVEQEVLADENNAKPNKWYTKLFKRANKNDKEKKTTKEKQPQNTKERILSIDRFRGLCMFAMVCSFVFGIFSAFGFFAPVIDHAPDGFQVLPGVSFADLFAAMFIFVIGLTMVKSFKSREAKFGTRKAYFQLATRFLALIGVGILFNGFENGWAELFIGESTWADFSIKIKIFGVMFWIAVALLIVYVISVFVKNPKFKKVSEMMLRYFLAIAGVMALYFILVSTGEKITPPVDGERFGGWEWDTLQNIGLAGLLALPFVKFDKWGRLTMVGIIFTVMTVLMQNGLFPLANSILEGGIFGGFSWACILLLGSVFADLKDHKLYWVLTSLLLLISVVLIVGFDFIAAKRGCTPVYAMFCASVSAMIWGGLNFLNNWKPKFDFFAVWGSNAILTYILTIFFVGMILGGVFSSSLSSVNIGVAIVIALVILALFTVMNWLLKRKNIYIRI